MEIDPVTVAFDPMTLLLIVLYWARTAGEGPRMERVVRAIIREEYAPSAQLMAGLDKYMSRGTSSEPTDRDT